MAGVCNKSAKKCSRKQKRAEHRLIRDMNIESSEEPTQNLAICNVGLVTGVQREILEQFIESTESNFQLTMPPGRSYCFVSFSTIESASSFYNKVHGQIKVPGQNTVFYLLYIKAIPCIKESLGALLPSGLRILTEFVSPKQEATLLNSIDWEEEEENMESELKHRRVKHFGYKFRYEDNLVDIDNPITPIPEDYNFLQDLFQKHDCGYFQYDQLTINRYLPGQGIPPHIDTHSIFKDPILSLSLGSACIMDFKRGKEKVSIDLPARSLLVMSGESRYAWSHGICPRHNDNVETDNGFSTRPRGTRVSFTFRKTRTGDCNCQYSEYCNTKKQNSILKEIKIDDGAALEIENSYVHDVYEEISNHFSETRHKQWPNVTKFIESLELGSLLLDVGCGNGKYLCGQSSIFKMGCDRSTGLAEICRTKGFQIALANCLQLPFKTDSLDAVLCIAVIHHLSTHERRKQAVSEIMRVLRPARGKALIYVWAKEQNKDSVKSTYLKSNTSKNSEDARQREMQFKTLENNVTLPVHENRTEFIHSDMLVPWKRKGGGDFLRYYHVFENGELESLCSDVPAANIKKSYYDQGNWCVVLEKMCQLN
ncbi:alkylated DNA repair protein alkB homolog 8 [Copidosoma floridanum]|uniref:alkylated DNA repair protein alkB homolog 8 n=1 Tax=Copidosoma floridanum TaxID=29053 RepID=UPI0006C9CF71|nr:alkylated DNA repair protein alkB homolog 8 [Copidosoma floridanum]